MKLVIGDYESFLNQIFDNLKDMGVSLDNFKELDHIAYRTDSIEKYEEIKKKLLPFLKIYSDKQFNGRAILVGRFEQPLIYQEFQIEGIEILAPKENNVFKNSLEHAEFVIKGTLEGFRAKYKNIDFDLHAYSRDVNPELCIKFDNCAVKFHEISLLDVRKI